MNRFFVLAVAEKVPAEFFQMQARSANVKRAREILKKVPERPVEKESDCVAAVA